MFKRNIIFLLIASAFMGINANPSFGLASVVPQDTNIQLASDFNNVEEEETDAIKRISFRDKFKKTPEAQINNFFKKYNKYSVKNDMEKLKELYSDSYVNNDGFNKSIIFKIMEDSASTYKNIKYCINVEDIKINGNYAVAKIHETASGETTKPLPKISDTGAIKSDIYYINYLKKEDADWKITDSYTIKEEVELKYGEAKNSEITLVSPECVTEGSEYEVSMNVKTPDGVFIIGSIANEPIVYPQTQVKDVFRSVKSEELARVLKANTDGNNEYATASLAITRAQVEPASLVINMTGMAFVMRRVNVLNINKNNKIEEEGINAAATTKSKTKTTGKKR